MATNRPLGWTLAVLSILLLAAPSAQARGRHPKLPASGSAHREVTRTGPNGGSRSSSADTTWQRGNGAWTRDTVRTGPNGYTATTHDVLQRTAGGFSRETTRTGPGGVSTRTATESYDPASKTLTKDATATGPNGKTATSHTVVQRTLGESAAP